MYYLRLWWMLADAAYRESYFDAVAMSEWYLRLLEQARARP